MKQREQAPTFVPFFTGKRNGQYFYRGVRWRGDANLIGYGKLAFQYSGPGAEEGHVTGLTNLTRPAEKVAA